MNKDVILQGIAFPIRVARQVKMLAMSEIAVLITWNGGGLPCVDTHPNLNRKKWFCSQKELPKSHQHELFHVRVTNVSGKETHPPEGVIVAQ